jgi:8-oxo-dGTP diphosphatase
VDIIIEMADDAGQQAIVLIKRKFPPHGWALPGGFVDVGEPLSKAAVREAREETSLEVELTEQLFTYSDPSRDARRHTISTVFVARAGGTPRAEDDAAGIGLFSEEGLPELVFDHRQILSDYYLWRRTGKRPPPDR